MLKSTAILLATTAAVLAAPVLSTSAHAGLVTKTASIAATPTDWIGSGNSVNIAKFDSTLGKLLSVSVSVSETVNGSVTVSSTSYPVTVTSAIADAAILVVDPFQPMGGCSLTYSSCIANELTGADYRAVNVTSSTVINSALVANIINGSAASGDATSTLDGDVAFTSTASTYLNGFTGTGFVNMVLVTSTNLNYSVSGGGSLTVTQATTDAATVTVNYTYDTPEPASVALFGGALAALGWVRRRKAAR